MLLVISLGDLRLYLAPGRFEVGARLIEINRGAVGSYPTV